MDLTERGPGDPFWHAACEAVFAADSPVGKAILDRELRFVRINEALAGFNGLPVEGHIGRTVQEVLPNAYPTLGPLLNSVLRKEHATVKSEITVEMPNSNGELSEWEASYLPIAGANGQVVGIYVQAVNLTAKLKAEKALRQSEKQVRRVLDSLFAFVGVMTPEGILIEANRAPLEAGGIKSEDVLGKPFWDTYWWNYSAESQIWIREACGRAAKGEIVREDVTVRMAADSRMTLDFMIVPLRDDDGVITHLIPSAIDISERLAAQRDIERALRERTILLQEVHHRVKNNLQIIASLLRLQARGATPTAASVLQDSHSRVMAMARTHQLLYERHDLSSVALGPYLKRLLSGLSEAHGDALRRIRLRVVAPESGIHIDLQQAVPVALIVNELLTNAMKHAFPERESGEIVVTVAREEPYVRVDIEDDGVGLPAGLNLQQTTTLGFNLVRLLGEQLRADVRWPTPGERGARFSILLNDQWSAHDTVHTV